MNNNPLESYWDRFLSKIRISADYYIYDFYSKIIEAFILCGQLGARL